MNPTSMLAAGALGATEHSPGGDERTCRGAIGELKVRMAARDDAG